MQLSLRARLAVGLVAAILTTGLVSTVVGLLLIGSGLHDQALDKARLDLNSARLVYYGRVQEVRDHLQIASLSRTLGEGLATRDLAATRAELEQVRAADGLDFLDLTDAEGRVIMRAQNPRSASDEDSLAGNPVVAEILRGKAVAVGNLVLDSAALARESPALAERARIKVEPLAGESSATDGEVTSGLVIAAAASLADSTGARHGILVGGVLLNRDDRVVDQIRETIYQGQTYAGQPVGEGTIFLDDVRVATNLMPDGRHRAIGTMVDPAVRERVLTQGKPRVDLASVVGERHFTAYEPITDLSGKPIGILSLGIPEHRFSAVRHNTLLAFAGTTAVGVALALVLAGLLSRGISRPISSLAAGVQDLARGQLDRKIELPRSIREIAALAEGVNSMAASLKERELQLRYRTQEQLGKAERLAMIGRLAAGVAHEINNPLGGIMLFSSLLLRKAAPGTPEHENLERISHETKRCQRIVQGLLDFARKREPKLEIQSVDDVIDRTLQLVSHQALFQNIAITKRLDAPAARVRIDPSQIQQVLVNLVVNAAEAMEGKGKLVLRTHAIDGGKSVQLDITDTGCGISPENLEQLFEPFFTTKDGHGTGLGLSISRGIIENHGGTIWVDSTLQQGTTFSVSLPIAEPAA